MANERRAAAFGQEVRRRREASGLTLEALAERSELTPNYIGSIEIGRRDPSLSTILALAKGFGVPANELFGTIPELSPTSGEAAALFDEMPPEIQKAVMTFLHTIHTKPRK